jgi:pilus assembly protein Flp/PilA
LQRRSRFGPRRNVGTQGKGGREHRIMRALVQKVHGFLKSEDGPTATEYGVLLALICIGVITVMSAFGGHVEAIYTTLAGTMPGASSS